MAEEYFYGATLSETNASVTWDPNSKDEENAFHCKLIIKQVLLGREAKDGEFNVVQVETMSDREPIKIPIAVLKVGETRCVRTELEFPEAPVTFKLIEGNGPVHIHGQHLPSTVVEEYEDCEDFGDSEEELFVEEEGEDDGEAEGHHKKKRKLSKSSKGVISTSARNNKKNTSDD